MFGGDARAMVADRELDCRLSALDRIEPPELDLDRAPALTVLDGVLDDVLGHAQKFILVTENPAWFLRSGQGDVDRALLRQRRQCLDNLGDDHSKVDIGCDRQMSPHLDAREREQVIDQPRHAFRLVSHNVEEALACRRIVAGGPLQRVDEPQD